MGLILAVTLLFVLAFSIKVLLKFKIEQALFLSFCAVTFLLFLFGAVGYLVVGYYFIVGLSAALFVTSLALLAFSKKSRSGFSVKNYLTPGVAVFLLANLIYFFFMRGEIMAITDAAVHWGYATKWMYETGRIYIGVQTLSVPLLNYFLVKTAGYTESYLFLGRWMIMWTAIILPVSDVKWDKWYKVLLYAVMAYMILGVIDPVPKMFMDLPLGVVAGALSAMLAVMPNRPRAQITAAFGVVVLGNIKNGTGILFSIFVIGFAVLIYFTNNKKEDKRHGIYCLAAFSAALVFAELFRRVTHESNIKDNAEAGMVIRLDYQQIVSKLTQTTILGLIIVTVVVAAFFVFLVVKKNKEGKRVGLLYKTTLAVMCLFAALTLYKVYSGFLSSLSYNDQVIFINYWEKYFVKGYFGWQIRNLIGMIIAFTVACGLLCLKKEHVKSFGAQSAYMALCMLFYAFALIVAYLDVFIEIEAADYAAMHRYIGSSIVFVAMWITGYIALSDGIWQEEKRQIVAAVILLAFLSRETPAMGTVYNYGLRGEAGVHKGVIQYASEIKNNTDAGDKIYFISQEYDNSTYLSDWSANAWIRYEIAPRYLNWVFWSLGKEFDDVDPSTLNVDSDDFKNILLEEGYDYVYLYKTDEKFWESYGGLFSPESETSNRKLYKVLTTVGYLLEPVSN